MGNNRAQNLTMFRRMSSVSNSCSSITFQLSNSHLQVLKLKAMPTMDG